MIDEEGNQSIGYSRRLRDAAKIPSTDISKLQSMYPNIRNAEDLSRALNACAEHMTFESCTQPFITFAIQITDGIVYAVRRCKNCAQYPLGNVISHALHGEWVPSALVSVPKGSHYCSTMAPGTLYVTLQNGQYRKSRT